jgi:hypothetical protein
MHKAFWGLVLSLLFAMSAALPGCTTFGVKAGVGESCKSKPCKHGLVCVGGVCQPDGLPDVVDALDVAEAEVAEIVEAGPDAPDARPDIDLPEDPGTPDVPDVPVPDVPDLLDPGTDGEVHDVPTDEAGPDLDVVLDTWEEETVTSTIGKVCDGDDDCLDGKCLDWEGGKKLCSGPCTNGCPDGTLCTPIDKAKTGYEYECRPQARGLCFPCTTDADCPATNARCMEMPGGNFCGAPCPDDVCPDGFTCKTLDTPDLIPAMKKQCYPTAASCACTETTEGQAFLCAVIRPAGKCIGAMTCKATEGWGKCTAFLPEDEVCDGKDNDCDEAVDEGFSWVDWDGSTKTVGQSCGVGSCAGGFVTCIALDKAECSTAGNKLAQELCGDGKDNNCSGQTDEGCYSDDLDGDGVLNEYDKFPTDAARYPGAKEPCCPPSTPPEQAVELCDYDCDGLVHLCDVNDKDFDGHVDVAFGGDDCNDSDATVYPGAPEKCDDGIDQDCLGGDLACSSIKDTDGDAWPDKFDCNPDDPEIHPGAKELCDNEDNNCDGVIDEANPEGGAVCGVSSGECTPGHEVCTHYKEGGVKIECIGATGKQDEICDEKDNDCDGLTDEDYPDVGQACDTDDLDKCPNGKNRCRKDGKGVECGAETVVDLMEICGNKIDDDCNGFTDDGCFPADKDGDGFPAGGDCDDLRAEVHPGAKEPCCNPALTGEAAVRECDRNCDGKITPCDPNDKDMDGHVAKAAGGDDCDDTLPGGAEIYPGAPEKCGDGIDQNCDGSDVPCAQVTDKDGDGYSPPADCNDKNADVHPWADEKCNDIDDDCDGTKDNGNPEGNLPCGDSVGACKPGVTVCIRYYEGARVECVPEQGPAKEICDGKDNNCNGTTDEYFPDLGKTCDGSDLDLCPNGVYTCRPDGSGTWCESELVENIVEICDGKDNDCDGLTDEGYEYNGAGIGQPCKGRGECGVGIVECSSDKKHATCSSNPDGSKSESLPETCDRKDNDCDGVTDNGLLYLGLPIGAVCKGYGACGTGKVECSLNKPVATCSSNADGTKPGVKSESCNGLDDDCDGHTDEGLVGSAQDCKYLGACAGILIPAKCAKGKWQCDYSVVLGYEAVEQSCDAIDNDCNGKTDEIFPVGKACDGDDPDLCETGTYTCKPDHSDVECVNESGEMIERCDGADNDCDGLTDEGFDVGLPCDGDDSDECVHGTYTCKGDGSAVECINEDPVNLMEKCNLLDDDCDGETDEDFPVGQACDGDDPDSCATGHWECRPDTLGVECLDDTGAGKIEKCDGVDNDCDGQTDEDFFYQGLPLHEPCAGIGECGATLGVVVCNPSKDGATCSTNPDGTNPQNSPEICDLKDNDCDGTTDNGLEFQGKPLGGPCSALGQCGSGQVVCSPLEKVPTCSTAPNGTDPKNTSETCDNVDNDCNGVTDDIGIPDISMCKQKGVCDPAVVQSSCINGQWICDYLKVPDYQDGIETLCDGKDNNCDGQIDELYPVGQPCDGDDEDQCQNGTRTCKATKDGVECVNENPAGIKETCGNGTDDDCDGKTDEEGAINCANYYKDLDQDAHGQLGQKKCLCVKGQVPFYTAAVGDDCNDSNKDVFPGHAELCNGVDDNCNGKTDEDFADLGKACDGDDPDLCKNGTFKCDVSGLGLACDGDYSAVETCNGKDDDCDGTTDEDYPVGKPCDGDDTDLCQNGTYTCKADGSGVECVNETVKNITEACNAKDDDCDGSTDEDFPDKDKPCDGDDTDKCKNGTATCKADGSATECINEKIKDIKEICDNINNDCDGSTDEDWPLKGKKCDMDPGGDIPCATGTWVCKSDKTDVNCVNDVKCAYGSSCQPSGAETVPDDCVCGTLTGCNILVATQCNPSEQCVCGSNAACTNGETCQGSTCKCGSTGAPCPTGKKCVGGKCV